MGIDLEKLKEKMEKMKKGGGYSNDTVFWRPPETGVGEVRFMDYPHSDTDPFVELWFHYRIGTGPHILCPRRNWGKTCPICEWANSMDNEGADKELAKDLWAKQRFFGVVVDRGDAKLTPKLYGFSKTVYLQLVEKLYETQFKHYLETDKGIDVSVKLVHEKGNKYPKTSLTWSRADTELASAKDVKELIAAVPNVEDIFKPITANEIKERLNQWLEWKSENAEENSGEERRGKKDPSFDEEETKNAESVSEELERALATLQE